MFAFVLTAPIFTLHLYSRRPYIHASATPVITEISLDEEMAILQTDESVLNTLTTRNAENNAETFQGSSKTKLVKVGMTVM